jgi:hypothetical protein
LTRALGIWAALVSSCGSEAATAVTEIVRQDARRILEVVSADSTNAALADVDRAVERELPVKASGLLEQGAIPAARRHLTRLADLELESNLGKSLRDEAILVYQARLSALSTYQALLARGQVVDVALFDSIRAQRQAQEAILALDGRLREVIREGRDLRY